MKTCSLERHCVPTDSLWVGQLSCVHQRSCKTIPVWTERCRGQVLIYSVIKPVTPAASKSSGLKTASDTPTASRHKLIMRRMQACLLETSWHDDVYDQRGVGIQNSAKHLKAFQSSFFLSQLLWSQRLKRLEADDSAGIKLVGGFGTTPNEAESQPSVCKLPEKQPF